MAGGEEGKQKNGAAGAPRRNAVRFPPNLHSHHRTRPPPWPTRSSYWRAGKYSLCVGCQTYVRLNNPPFFLYPSAARSPPVSPPSTSASWRKATPSRKTSNVCSPTWPKRAVRSIQTRAPPSTPRALFFQATARAATCARSRVARAPPWLLGALAGRNLNCVTRSRKAAAALKEEYHAFRDRGGVVLTASSLALLAGLHRAGRREAASESLTLTPPLMVGVQALLAWLLYFYTALALREHVLVVNGSNIRPWWIRHHVWSAATVVLTLTLPVDSPSVRVFVWKLLCWTAAQGGVMMLQNRYQRRRMYTRIALGRAAAMDVVSGESSGAAGQLLALYPFLFGLQAAQVAVGAQMVGATAAAALSREGWLDLEARESDLRGSRGVAVAGAAMVCMGLANFYHTVLTVLDKRVTRAARTGGRAGGSAGGARSVAGGTSTARPWSAGRPPLPRPPSAGSKLA